MTKVQGAWLVLALALVAPGAAMAADAAADPPSGSAGAESGAPGAATSGKRYRVTYRFDGRATTGMGNSAKLEVMALEAEVTGEVGQSVEYAVQVPVYTAMTGRGRDMHFGNLYAIFRRKLGEPTVKIGQFVIPFGNLAYYETHTRPVQTLYRYSLGVRIDPGVEVDGFLGKELEYQIALTTGNGPFRKDNNSNKVITARIGRQFEIGGDELRVGLSALAGVLPVFSLMTDPVMGEGQVVEFSPKRRVALDAEYYRGPVLFRAEVVAGDDDGRPAYGHWVQVSYPLSYRTSLDVGTERWSQFTGGFTSYWAGIEQKLSDRQRLRLAVQRGMSREAGMRMSDTMVTAQLLIEF